MKSDTDRFAKLEKNGDGSSEQLATEELIERLTEKCCQIAVDPNKESLEDFIQRQTPNVKKILKNVSIRDFALECTSRPLSETAVGQPLDYR